MTLPLKKFKLNNCHPSQSKITIISRQIQGTQEEYRSSNLLSLATKNKNKLNLLSRRKQRIDSFALSSFKGGQNKLLLYRKSNTYAQNQEEEQMNKIYQQNQKLGYRINYLNDENNFYKISINNIKKLNNNIHKDLDSHNGVGKFAMTHKKINTKTVSTLDQFQPGNIKRTQTSLRKIGMSSKAKYSNQIAPGAQDSSNQNSAEVYGKYNQNLNVKNKIQASNVSEPFSLISNKIHIKNLQMKVGNSIRKTQKLKKIYEGSISSLTKKTEQLELQVNKLARQAEYYQIQCDLLGNIYKADYYMNLNREWVQAQADNQESNNKAEGFNGYRKDAQFSDLQSERREKDKIQEYEDYQDYYEYFKKDAQNQLRAKKKEARSGTSMGKKKPSTAHEDLHFPKRVQPTFGLPSNVSKQVNPQAFPMAIRFLSGQYNHRNLGKGFKNTFHSALLAKPKQKKDSGIVEAQELHSFRKPPSAAKKSTTNNFNSLQNTQHFAPFSPRQSHQHLQQRMTQKQLFSLPSSLINFITCSLQKEEIQHVNKLQSLRKEEKEQKKTSCQLQEAIQNLSADKQELKRLIDQQFSHFFINSVNSMNTITPFNSTTSKKPTLHVQKKSFNPQTKGRKQTLHQSSSSTPSMPLSLYKSPFISIQERKQEADQLYLCNLYQKELFQSILKQDKLLEQQYKINQQYKQKIIDRNQQQNKQLKVLEEQVDKCTEQVKQIKYKYKNVCQTRGRKASGSYNNGNLNNKTTVKLQQKKQKYIQKP